MSSSHSVYAPQAATVEAGADGVPSRVGRLAVDGIRKDWLIEDRWWTAAPLRRRYFELVLADGRDVVVFHDLVARRWLRQQA